MASRVEGQPVAGLPEGEQKTSFGGSSLRARPLLASKPIITPKPFSLQRNTTLRSIHAPKTHAAAASAPSPFSIRTLFPGAADPGPAAAAPDTQRTGEPAPPTEETEDRPDSVAVPTVPRPEEIKTSPPVGVPAVEPPRTTPEGSPKDDQTAPAGASVKEQVTTSDGVAGKDEKKGLDSTADPSSAQPKTNPVVVVQPNPTPTPDPIQTPAVTLRRPKASTGILDQKDEDPQSKDPAPRRGLTRNRLSMELTKKFESGGLPLPTQPPQTTRNKYVGKTPAAATEPEIVNSREKDGEVEKVEAEEDRTGGTSIKRRITLLFDSSSRPDVLVRREEPQADAQSEGTGGAVKDRIKNWAVDTNANTDTVIQPQTKDNKNSSDSVEPPSPTIDRPDIEHTSKEPQPTEISSGNAPDLLPEVSSPDSPTGEPQRSSTDQEPSTQSSPDKWSEPVQNSSEVFPEPGSDEADAPAANPFSDRTTRRSVRFGTVERDDGKPPVLLGSEPESSGEEEDGSGDEAHAAPTEEEKRRQEEEREKHEEFVLRKQREEQRENVRRMEEQLREKELKEEERRREESAQREKEEAQREKEEAQRERLRLEEREREEERERVRREDERLREEKRKKEQQIEEDNLRKERERQKEQERLKEEERQREKERLKEEERARQRAEEERQMEEERERERQRAEEERQREEERSKEENERQSVEERLKVEEKERERLEERLRVEEKERQRVEERLREEAKVRQQLEERLKEEERERHRIEERLREEEGRKETLRNQEMERERQAEVRRVRQRDEDRERARQKEEVLRAEERSREEARRREEERLRAERVEREAQSVLAEKREKDRLIAEAEERERERRRQQALREEQERERRVQEALDRKRAEELEVKLREAERAREEERRREEGERRREEGERQREKERLQEEQRQEEERIQKQQEAEEEERAQKIREETARRRRAEEEEEERTRRQRVRETELSSSEENKGNLINFDDEDAAQQPQLAPTSEPGPLEVAFDDFSVRKSAAEIVFDDFSVKPKRWGTKTKGPQPDVVPEGAEADSGLGEVWGRPVQEARSSWTHQAPQLDRGEESHVAPRPRSPQVELWRPREILAVENSEPEVEEDEEEEEEEEEEGGLEEEERGEEPAEQKRKWGRFLEELDVLGAEAEPNNESEQQYEIREHTDVSEPDAKSPTPALEQSPDVSVDDLDGVDLTEPELPAFPEISTPLLDNQVQRSRAELLKRRSQRTRLPRTRQRSDQAFLTAGPASVPDWRLCDTAEQTAGGQGQESSDEEPEEKRGTKGPPTSQRVPVFPGLGHSALLAQLKKKTGGGGGEAPAAAVEEKDVAAGGEPAAPSPSQLSRSPRSAAMLPGAARVLPPIGGKDDGKGPSPSWLQELKKKRMSQQESGS